MYIKLNIRNSFNVWIKITIQETISKSIGVVRQILPYYKVIT